jgi:PAS domain S-box-containing protein
VLLVVVCLVPAFVLLGANALDRYEAEQERSSAEAAALASVAAEHASWVLEEARPLLEGLRSVAAGDDLEAVSRTLAAELERNPRYTNLAVADAGGDVIASAVPLQASINVADLAWFQRVSTEQVFIVGDYQMGRIVGVPVVVCALPVRAADEADWRAVYCSLAVSDISSLWLETDLAPGATVLLLDRSGTVIARQPDHERWAGRALGEASVVRAALGAQEGVVELTGLDGVRRLNAFEAVGDARAPWLYAGAGIATEEADRTAGKQLVRSLALMGAAGLIAIGLAWAGANASVRGLRRLRAAAGRVAAGDLDARARITAGSHEVIDIGDAFDSMAAAVQEADLQRLDDATRLARLNRAYAIAAHVAQASAFATEKHVLLEQACKIAVEDVGLRMAWVGLADRDADRVAPVAHAGHVEGYLDDIGIALSDVPEGRGPTGMAIRTGSHQVVDDIAADPRMAPWRDAALARGYRSVACFPLRTHGETVGVLNLYAAQTDYFTEDLVSLLGEMVPTLSRTMEALDAEALLGNTQRDLAASEERFRRLAENARDMIYRMSLPDGRYEYVSPAAEELFGYSPQEFYDSPGLIGEVIHPDWREYFAGQWERLLAGEMPPTYEYQIIAKSGETKWMNQRNVLVRDERGDPIAIEGIVTDATRSKDAELIADARQALLAFSLGHTLDELLEETLGRLEGLTGSRIGFYHFLDSDQCTITLQAWSSRTVREFCSAEGKGHRYDISKAGVWADCVRQRRPVIHNDYAALPDKKGLPPGHAQVVRELTVPVFRGDLVVAILGVGNKQTDYDERDLRMVTDLADLAWEMVEAKRAEQEILELNIDLEGRVRQRTAELEAANRELEAFSYSVSHDLRAPLRAIDGFSQALLEDYEPVLDETGRDFLHRVKAAAVRMASLIDDLLSLSRLSRSEIELEELDLSAMADEVITEFREREPGRALETVVAPDLTALADKALVRVVLDNLLGNAFKFTGRTDGARVEFGSERDGGTVWYYVRDNGAGFDMAHADRLFGPFARLHAVEEFEGTGIGLATVQRVIHRHGGQVRAVGAVGEGATFYFTLGHTKGGDDSD